MATDAPRIGSIAPTTSKGKRSREHLVSAAREVFAARGFANSRVTDIVDRAGMSNGSFYRYFTDKRDILLAVLETLYAELYSFSRAPWEPGDPMRSVYVTTVRYLRLYRTNAGMLRTLVEAAQTNPEVEQMWHDQRKTFFDRIERSLHRAAELKILRPDIDPGVAAPLLGGMTEFYAYLWFALGRLEDEPIEAVAEQITYIWGRGVFVPEVLTARFGDVDPS